METLKTEIRNLLKTAQFISKEQRSKILEKLESIDLTALEKLKNLLIKSVSTQGKLFQNIQKRNPKFFSNLKEKVSGMQKGNAIKKEETQIKQDLDEIDLELSEIL